MGLVASIILLFIIIFLVQHIYALSKKVEKPEETLPTLPSTVAEMKELRDPNKHPDLHQGRGSWSVAYCETSFHACFYEIFNMPENTFGCKLTGSEIQEIAGALKIKIDLDLLKQVYKDDNNHSVEVFHAEDDELVFMYFDLEKSETDQNHMFFFGVSCRKTEERQINEKLMDVFRKLGTTSPFSFMYHAPILYRKVFHSNFYFYKNDQVEHRRQMHHHNLKERN